MERWTCWAPFGPRGTRISRIAATMGRVLGACQEVSVGRVASVLLRASGRSGFRSEKGAQGSALEERERWCHRVPPEQFSAFVQALIEIRNMCRLLGPSSSSFRGPRWSGVSGTGAWPTFSGRGACDEPFVHRRVPPSVNRPRQMASEDATAIREKEHKDFAAEEAELVETIDMIHRAVGILERELAKARWAQSGSQLLSKGCMSKR